jgi:thiol-disulfide isomerase/thioredoxin
MLPRIAVAVAGLATVANGEGILEPAGSKVNVVTANSFNRFVKSHPITIMEFYAPWCGHCQNMAPVYREAAEMMSEIDNIPNPVAFAKIDDGDDYNHNTLRAGAEDMFNYTSYPTLLVFKDKKIKVANKEHWKRKYKGKRWQYYGGGRDKPDDFVFYLSAISKSLDPFDEERKIRPGFYKKGGKHESTAIVDLEPTGPVGFNTTILEDPNNNIWVVEFYSDRCPFCNSLAPEIIKASKQVMDEKPGRLRFAAVNSRVYDEIADAHEVTSWPWVTAFYHGSKLEDMMGLGGAESVVRFANEMYDKYWKKKGVKNKFLEGPWASGETQCSADGGADGECAGGGGKAASKDLLETLLKQAVKFGIETKKGMLGVWKDLSKGKISLPGAVASFTKKLKPVTDLTDRIAALEAEIAELKKK